MCPAVASNTDEIRWLPIPSWMAKWSSMLVERCEEKKRTVQRQIQPIPILYAYIAPIEIVQGDLTLQNVRNTLLLFDADEEKERSVFQKDINELFVKASLKTIYGETQFLRHQARIMEEQNMASVHYNQQIAVKSPRRWGKTRGIDVDG